MNCDHNLFLALNFDGGPFMDRLMLTVSGTTMWLPLYALILWLVWRRDGWRNVILFTALMIAALWRMADAVPRFRKAALWNIVSVAASPLLAWIDLSDMTG